MNELNYTYRNSHLSGMRRKFNAMLALLLILVLVLPSLPGASAASDPAPASIRIGTAAGAPGDYVDVPIFFDDNGSGLYVYRSDITVAYDPQVLEPATGDEARISGFVTNVDADAELTVDASTSGNLKLGLLLSDFIDESGELITLRFKVKDGAASGDSILSLVTAQLYEDTDPIDAAMVNGKITVAAAGQAEIEIGSGYVRAGEAASVSVPVRALSLDKAVASYGMRIKFDPSVMSAEEIIGQDTVSNYDNTDGWLIVAWVDLTGGDASIPASTEAQTLFTIKFAVSQNADSGEYPLTVEQPSDVRQLTFTDVDVVEMNKTITAGKIAIVVAPEAPTAVTANPGDGKIRLEWPAVPLAETYKVFRYEGSAAPSDPADWVEIAGNVETNRYTAEGLTNGTHYVFAVKAVNLAGESDLSPASEAVAPQPVPGAPENFSATPGDGTAVISFAKPTGSNGAPVAKYRVEAVLNNVVVASKEVPTNSENVYSASFDGLNNGETYTIRIYAVSLVGDSEPLIGTVRPVAKPLAPTIVTVVPGNKQVEVKFSAPANAAQAPVASYIVTASPGEQSVTVSGDLLSAVVSGLTNGTSYTFTVVAQNAAGTSDPSAPSEAAIPKAPSTGSGGGGGSTPQGERITLDVNDGSGKGGVVASATIERTTRSDGGKKDEVTLTGTQAAQAVKQLKEAGSSAAKIIIPDVKDEVSELNVRLPVDATKPFAEQDVAMQIWTDNAGLIIPSGSLKDLKEEVYFHIVPIKAADERKRVEQRLKGEPLLLQLASADGLQLVGRPMTIETNLSSREVTLVLPVKGELSQEELRNLSVFIEHSDGTKEVVKGELVAYNGSSTQGIQFTITKFSTFSIVKANILSHTAYIEGYSDGTFRPDQPVRRAEMAALLTRALPGSAGASSNAAYIDLPNAAWAKQAITQATARGYMQVAANGKFMPEKFITRAEMAAIVDRLLRSGQKTANPNSAKFKDATGHWASEAIDRVSAVGVMTGSGNGLFRPNDSLTRAEAVVILNRVLDRGPLANTEAKWKDVPENHWAFGHIQEASLEHRYTRSANGGETAIGQ